MRKEYKDRQHAPLREPYASEFLSTDSDDEVYTHGQERLGEQGAVHEWKIATEPNADGKWEVIDWAGNLHAYESKDEALAFIDRDKRLFGLYASDAHADVTDQITRALENQSGVESTHGEQAANARRQVEAGREVVGGQGNRRSRRRASRAANRKAATG